MWQTPVLPKLQNLCHMQCVGKALPADLSSDEKQEALQQAMAGKQILLCLDDLWCVEISILLPAASSTTVSANSMFLLAVLR